MRQTPLSPVRMDRRRRGGAALEMALVFPLVILVLLGAADFGRFAYSFIAVSNAARAGASQGSMNPYSTTTRANWETAIRNAVRDEMAHVPGFDAGRLTVTVTTAAEPDGMQRFSVNVAYPFETLANWGLLPGSVRMEQSVTFRILR